MKKIIILIAVIIMATCSSACESSTYVDSTPVEYNEFGEQIIDDYTGYYNYAKYKNSDELVKIDSCVKLSVKGSQVYDIVVDGNRYRVYTNEIDLYTTKEECPSEWAWKD